MKTSKFYTEERSSAVEKMEAIVDSAKVEGRELSDSETKEFDSLNEKANSLEGMAKRAASFEALQANKAAKSEPITEAPWANLNVLFVSVLSNPISPTFSGGSDKFKVANSPR